MIHTARQTGKFIKFVRFIRSTFPQMPVDHETLAIGILERLWHFTMTCAFRGDIGKADDEVIAEALGWHGEAQRIIDALCDCGWVDRSDEHRLLVHDWAEHAPTHIKKNVKRHGGFISESCSPEHDSLPKTTKQCSAEPVRPRKRAQKDVSEALPNQTKPNQTPPPTPSALETDHSEDQNRLGGDSGGIKFSLEKELTERGVGQNLQGAEAFYSRGLGDDHAKEILAVFDANPGAWHPGALVNRLKNARSELFADEGWPKKEHVDKPKVKQPPSFEMWRADVIKFCKKKGKPVPDEHEIRERYGLKFGVNEIPAGGLTK